MRFPFDIIAALLALEAVRPMLVPHFPENLTLEQAEVFAQGWLANESTLTSLHAALLALGCYWLVVWLLHEGLARADEWRTRFGHFPQGWPAASEPSAAGKRLHPQELHARGVMFAQAANVILYVLFLWHYRWNLKTCAWPEWIGLHDLSPRTLALLQASDVAGLVFDFGPFLVALIISWLPKWRSGGRARRRPHLLKYLSFEARLTLLPLALVGIMAVLHDASKWFWPESAPHAVGGALTIYERLQEAALVVGGLLFFVVLVLPMMIIRIWRCRPMEPGPLLDRMSALWKHSGVPARAILSWGPRGSGFTNACALGPWGRMRYILISPDLADELTLEECEAVLAHELGHAKFGHLTTIAVVTVSLVAVTGIVLEVVPAHYQPDPLTSAGLLFAALWVYMRFVFGALSRLFEREADLYALELTGTPQHLISALEKIGLLSGGIREVFTWTHGSISDRVARLSDPVLTAPAAAAAFHARMKMLRRAFYVFCALSTLGFFLWAA